jgi:hypothetical protein
LRYHVVLEVYTNVSEAHAASIFRIYFQFDTKDQMEEDAPPKRSYPSPKLQGVITQKGKI